MNHAVTRRFTFAVLAAVLTVGFAANADAQRGKGKGKGGPPVRVVGQVAAFEGNQLTVKNKAGETLRVTVAKSTRVLTLTPAKFADLKKGDFIASAGIRQRNGNLHAIELRIFPEQMRGRGEGHRPFRGGPDHTMTNATIDAVVGRIDQRTIKVAYKGGEKTIVVPKDVVVMRMGRGKAELLKRGTNVSVFARKKGDRIIAARISVRVDR